MKPPIPSFFWDYEEFPVQPPQYLPSIYLVWMQIDMDHGDSSFCNKGLILDPSSFAMILYLHYTN